MPERAAEHAADKLWRVKGTAGFTCDGKARNAAIGGERGVILQVYVHGIIVSIR